LDFIFKVPVQALLPAVNLATVIRFRPDPVSSKDAKTEIKDPEMMNLQHCQRFRLVSFNSFYLYG
jgi:hypothetical protein